MACVPTQAINCKIVNLPVLPKYPRGTAFRKIKNSCKQKSVESTDLSQRQIHGDVRTEASKEAVWRITASDCYAYVSPEECSINIQGVFVRVC